MNSAVKILTNQSIKIGRRAWPTRGHGKKRLSPPVFLNNWLNFQVGGQFEIKILNSAGPMWHKHNIFHTSFFKNKLDPAIIWKLVICQPITSKNTRPRGQFEIKILNSAEPKWHKHNIFHTSFLKNKLEPAIIWKLVICQRITSKNTRPRWVDTWACYTARWYWSAGTLFDSCQLITTLMCNQCSPGLPNKLESSVCLWCG